jgi:hypothetical protein
MRDLTLVLQIIALVCFIVSWLNLPVPSAKPLNWLAFGLFLWLLSLMLGGVVLHQAS